MRTRTKTNFRDSTDRAAVASNLVRIADAVTNAPDVDSDKVEAIRNALSRGEYEVDPERIAEKLMRLDTDLRGGQPDRRR